MGLLQEHLDALASAEVEAGKYRVSGDSKGIPAGLSRRVTALTALLRPCKSELRELVAEETASAAQDRSRRAS